MLNLAIIMMQKLKLLLIYNPQSKNQRYDKRDFVARKHGKEREPWVQKPMPFTPKPSKKKDDEDFKRFVEMLDMSFCICV